MYDREVVDPVGEDDGLRLAGRIRDEPDDGGGPSGRLQQLADARADGEPLVIEALDIPAIRKLAEGSPDGNRLIRLRHSGERLHAGPRKSRQLQTHPQRVELESRHAIKHVDKVQGLVTHFVPPEIVFDEDCDVVRVPSAVVDTDVESV